jgi:hypothetical protein
MKYALFILGMVLIIVGGYFLYSGSNIIEVERGWSSVIAGTTALTGGVITLGLAGVVKSLEDLKRVWTTGVARPEIGALNLEPQALAATAEMPVAPNFGPVPAGVEAVTAFEVEIPAEEPSEPAEVIPSPLAKDRSWLAPKFGAAPSPSEPSAAIAELRRRVAEDLALDWPGFNPPPIVPADEPSPIAPEPAEAVTPPPLHLEDIEAEAPETKPDDSAAEAYKPETAATPPEPPSEAPDAMPEAATESATEEAAQVPEPEAPRPKAIGRYEAEGTVYVMFADGSIEAQSPQGTRHFKSMADLKASFQS